MNLTIKRALIRAVIIVLLVLTFMGCYIAKAEDKTDRPTTETQQTTSTNTENATQEPQAATEPATIPTEEQKPTQETNATTTATAPTEPQKTETPTETTLPETVPPAATEPSTEPETHPTEPEPKETAPTYTPENLDLLALVIYQEAGSNNYSDETRLMVGSVVMNRVEDDRFPDTIYDVLMQERQYGLLHWTGPVWPQEASHETEALAVERAYTIAERILLGERALPEDVIWQAEFIQGTEVVAYQDGIYFCR